MVLNDINSAGVFIDLRAILNVVIKKHACIYILW